MERLLITGGSGLLALNWACAVRDRFDVVLGTHRHAVQLSGTRAVALDLQSAEAFTQQLQVLAPDIVVHTAGMASVDRCERHPREAEHTNRDVATNVALATQARGVKLVHISTDHFFPGDKPLVTEHDAPRPLNVYARTKLQAEQQVQTAHPQALIVRTNFFGWGSARRQSFSDWIINNLRLGQALTMFDDVYFTPILADTLALTAHDVLARNASGIYHMVGDQRVSKFDFGQQLAQRFGLRTALIARGKVDQSKLSAPRPHDMSLDNSRVRSLLNRDIGKLEVFFEELYRQEQQGRAAELKNVVAEI
ncbi:MAG: SDR family oxidoreductase [Gammaproteobacteria bacterium]|nr:SDR family oxidoreductase [Gammaproteobacteria bacterium]